MSAELDVTEAVVSEPVLEPEAKVEVKEASVEPKAKLLKVHGKEFDVSTDLGLLQAQAWAEAISSVVGRQGQELGDLRKRTFSNDSKSSSDSEVAKKAKDRAANGDIEGAIDEVLSFARETEAKASRKLDIERKNNALWDEYFTGREDLAKKLGKDKVRKIAEATLDLYNPEQDVFQVMDDFFMPLVKSETPTPIKSESEKKPPLTVSGKAKPSPVAPAKSPDASKVSFEDVLGARTLSRK